MSFAPLLLPDGLRRDSVLNPKFRPNGYLDALDRETLWYDAVWRDGLVHLVCPPLNNLRAMLKRGGLDLDGAPARIAHWRRYKRHEVIALRAAKPPVRVGARLGAWRGETPVNRAAPDTVAGLNTAFYVSRNNDLRWIVDHARFHRRVHGLQALVIVDNASDAYAPADIEVALAPVGLDRVVILSAPFKYGPVGRKPFRRTEKYMQTALFNVLRLRLLGAARAILCCDVDELVLTDGPGVFEVARRSRLGFVQIAGAWHYPEPGRDGPFRHADHTRIADPPKPCPPKWCLDPSGPLGGWSWDIHGIERLPFLHGRTAPGLSFMHCRGVTTGWKSAGRLSAPAHTVPAPAAIAALRALD